uniref:NAD(P)H quinone dehydrogenase 1 n=2 Tax=Cyprinus carpio TaxID=7962 RepID=A0A8C2FFT2_CYPCA
MVHTVLIVYAHQSAGSFNAAVKDAAVDALKKQGCNVLVSDLYEMKFKATATKEDINGAAKNPEHFCYGNETMLAWQEGRLASDIVDEHKKLKEADLVIFQSSLVVHLSVLVYESLVQVLRDGMLKVHFGSCSFMVSQNGTVEYTKLILSTKLFLNGVLNYCGFQVLAPQIFWAPTHLSPEAREGLLEGWRARLQGLLNEAPLTFPPVDIFDEGKGFQLKTEIREKQAESLFGLTVGHHLEKPLPPHNQMKAGV